MPLVIPKWFITLSGVTEVWSNAWAQWNYSRIEDNHFVSQWILPWNSRYL